MNEIRNIDEIKTIGNKIIEKGWINTRTDKQYSAGNILEKEFGIETNNLPIADYKDFELKTKFINSDKYITLFCATPDTYLFEIKRLYSLYSYPDKKEPKFKVFNLSFYGNKITKIGDKYNSILSIEDNKISLNIYNINGILIDNITGWSHDLIREKLEMKLKYLVLFHVSKNNDRIKYTSYDIYQLNTFDEFLKSVKNGSIRVTFKISVFKNGQRKGQIHDHGTSFDIDESMMNKLFTCIYSSENNVIKKDYLRSN